MLIGLNHITLAVKNIDKSFDFYVKLLEMKAHAKWAKGAYLTLGDLWFCLNLDDSSPSKDYTHIAFSISKTDFASMKNENFQNLEFF